MAASLLLAPAAQGAGASRRDRRGGREDGLSAEALIVLHPGERRAAVVAELRAVLLGERAGVDGLAQHPDPGLARRRRREVRVALPAVRVRAVRGGRQENIQRAREGQGMRAHPTGGYQRTMVAFGSVPPHARKGYVTHDCGSTEQPASAGKGSPATNATRHKGANDRIAGLSVGACRPICTIAARRCISSRNVT